jgi:hypothetical protein
LLLIMLAIVAVERGSASAQQPIRARIVINQVYRTSPSRPGRVALLPNVEVVQNEVIDTAADGTTLIVFPDNTQLSVCPSSEIVLNRAELDQTAGRSALDVTLPKGCARFASGLLLKTAYFATPTATIRSTGTILTITVSARGATTVSVEEAPCCMDRRCGRTEPDPCSGSCDADVVRASEVQHSVQHVGGDGHFGRLPPPCCMDTLSR